jgi:hypothetical protein
MYINTKRKKMLESEIVKDYAKLFDEICIEVCTSDKKTDPSYFHLLFPKCHNIQETFSKARKSLRFVLFIFVSFTNISNTHQ